jgi:predicted DNA binding CopG/RHH family protein
MMAEIDAFETEILEDFERGALESVATKEELARLKAAARATAVKDRRVNIRLSSGDLRDLQARALEEGLPYQTLIASVLHKFVTGRLVEPQASGGVATDRPARRAVRESG